MSSGSRTLLSINGAFIAWAHTALALTAFSSALVVGLALHYHKIVKNEFYGYPQEWFPSVSATIGDWYPERNLFQVVIAITSGPRFLLLLITYLLSPTVPPQAKTPASSSHGSTPSLRRPLVPTAVAAAGLLRTLTCGGWVYVTSTDDHDIHDIMMISYMVLTLPWMIGRLATTPHPNSNSDGGRVAALKWRKLLAFAFFGSIMPLIYFFIEHKVHRTPGAYTSYAFWEWQLILYDVLFDAVAAFEFSSISIQFVEEEKSAGPHVSAGTTLIKPALSGADAGLNFSRAAISEKAALRDIGDFLVDVYLAHAFWTNVTALGPSIFYWSVWGMGLTGVEAFLLVNLAPIILGVPAIRRLAASHRMVFTLSTVFGIGAFVVVYPTHRLWVTAFAGGMQAIGQAVAFWNEGRRRDGTMRVEREAFAFAIGIISTNVTKFANYSLNPLAPMMHGANGGWNIYGLLLGILACLYVFFREPQTTNSSTTMTWTLMKRGSWLPAAAGLGGLLFALHSLFSDSGTIITMAWTGWPLKGPTPVPHGALIIAASAIGLVLSTADSLVLHPAWWLAGSAGCLGLYVGEDWAAFWSGSILATFVFSMLPTMLREAARHGPAKTWGTAWLIYILLTLGNVWCVSYAFVPGGKYLRERTDLVLITMMFVIIVGCVNARKANATRLEKRSNTASKSLSTRSRDISEYVLSERSRIPTKSLLGLLTVISAATAGYRLNRPAPTPYNSQDRILTTGIWTLHFGLDSDARDSQRRVAKLAEELQLDVLGMLESDLQRQTMGQRDMTQYLAETLGMYADVGPGPQKHTWGAALLSKFPIKNSTHHLLPSPFGELAPAIHATLDVHGTEVDVVVSHNGQEEDPMDRMLQSRELGRLMRERYPTPTVFLGYVVTKPHAPAPAPYSYLVDGGRMLDVDPTDLERWCEYILFRGLRRTTYARVSRGGGAGTGYSAITDTELQLARFIVPPSNAPIDPAVDSSNGTRLQEWGIPKSWRLPNEFRDNGSGGLRGHKYHVFDEPRYFDA